MKYITEYRTIAIQHAVPLTHAVSDEVAIENIENGNARSYTNGDCIERHYESADAELFVGVMYRGQEVTT
jgi:hypothetical protein